MSTAGREGLDRRQRSLWMWDWEYTDGVKNESTEYNKLKKTVHPDTLDERDFLMRKSSILSVYIGVTNRNLTFLNKQ